MKGYKGEFCRDPDCPDPDCSGHGYCIQGTCVCRKGWLGADCGQTDPAARSVLLLSFILLLLLLLLLGHARLDVEVTGA